MLQKKKMLDWNKDIKLFKLLMIKLYIMMILGYT